jgi:MoaA/NifB/PqqE/SkfB family radical SAM enzyme
VTTITEKEPSGPAVPGLVWLDLTRKCQLNCAHCYNASGPDGEHGTMSRADWMRVLEQCAELGIRSVQLIGGEPILHPDAAALVRHALSLGLAVEVYSNLVHVKAEWWDLFHLDGVSVATSYYSDDPAEHQRITGRATHRMTRTNIMKAVARGIRLRVGIVVLSDTQRVSRARRDLEAIGVSMIRVDRARPFGRAAHGRDPDVSQLCGRCGAGKAAIGPTGEVSPCVFSAWLGLGNVHDTSLGAILGGAAMGEANALIRAATGSGACDPDEECSPGTPGSECNPKA